MVHRDTANFTAYELIFCVYAFGWALDQFASVLDLVPRLAFNVMYAHRCTEGDDGGFCNLNIPSQSRGSPTPQSGRTAPCVARGADLPAYGPTF